MCRAHLSPLSWAKVAEGLSVPSRQIAGIHLPPDHAIGICAFPRDLQRKKGRLTMASISLVDQPHDEQSASRDHLRINGCVPRKEHSRYCIIGCGQNIDSIGCGQNIDSGYCSHNEAVVESDNGLVETIKLSRVILQWVFPHRARSQLNTLPIGRPRHAPLQCLSFLAPVVKQRCARSTDRRLQKR